MSSTVSATSQNEDWSGGNKPMKASYGKLMMWFFIVSDALTFSGFLAAYGFSRFKFIDSWPIADEVFTHVPFIHGQELPMIYVAFMTFVLIMSSVTMVLAVDAGHHMKKAKVTFYLFWTVIGGAIFLGSQAWEWATFIKGDFGTEYKTVKRKSKEGDRLIIDFEGLLDGESFEGGAAEGFEIVLGKGTMIEGFEKGLIDIAPEKTVEVAATFPEDYHVENLAGREAIFKVTVNEVGSPSDC